MIRIKQFTMILAVLVTIHQANAQKNVDVLVVPAGKNVTKINPGGTTVLPSGGF